MPGFRGVLRMAEMGYLLPIMRRRLPEARLPIEGAGSAAALGATVVVSRAIRGSRLSPLTAELLGASLALVPAMASLRGSQVAGYHGAEHKAIGGYEHGQAAEQATKEHDRCGSHMVGPMLAATVVGNVLVNRLPASRRGPARLVAGVAAIGAATEVFGWMTRHHDNPVSRALRWPGLRAAAGRGHARADRTRSSRWRRPRCTRCCGWRAPSRKPSSRRDFADRAIRGNLDGPMDFFQGFGSWLLLLLWPLVLPACFIALVFFAYKMWRAMPTTKPNKIQPASGHSVRWHDVAGADEAREELEEIVEFLRDPKRFKKLGARVPKGVLLYGPPGTGKTLMAKAIATESGANFYFQSASSFVEMFVGVGSARIRRLFAEARKHQPSIIFIDELDAVGTARSGGAHNREHDQTLNQLLVELDGFDEADRLIIMGASNRLDDLDPALLRPGRFDRQIHVATPDLKGRREILAVHTRNKPLAERVDLGDDRAPDGRADRCRPGQHLQRGGDPGRARRGARRSPPRTSTPAVERVVAGLQQRKLITDKEKRVIAYHEAGHALVARLMSDDIHKVTIVPRGRALGFMMSLPEEDRYVLSKDELEDWLKVTLGGRAAEQVVFGRITNGAANDLERATVGRPLDGVRVGHGQLNHVASDAGRQLLAVGGDQAAARPRAARDHRQGLHRGAASWCSSTAGTSTCWQTRCWSRRRSTATEIDQLLIDLQPESNASGQIGVELPRDGAGAGQPAVHRPEPALHSEPPEQPDQL